ncbi:hypothetical protein VULLAG_LOCUS14073 [Vulpes lagopus]
MLAKPRDRLHISVTLPLRESLIKISNFALNQDCESIGINPFVARVVHDDAFHRNKTARDRTETHDPIHSSHLNDATGFLNQLWP